MGVMAVRTTTNAAGMGARASLGLIVQETGHDPVPDGFKYTNGGILDVSKKSIKLLLGKRVGKSPDIAYTLG